MLDSSFDKGNTCTWRPLSNLDRNLYMKFPHGKIYGPVSHLPCRAWVFPLRVAPLLPGLPARPPLARRSRSAPADPLAIVAPHTRLLDWVGHALHAVKGVGADVREKLHDGHHGIQGGEKEWPQLILEGLREDCQDDEHDHDNHDVDKGRRKYNLCSAGTFGPNVLPQVLLSDIKGVHGPLQRQGRCFFGRGSLRAYEVGIW
mmetsp:Transcript_81483/g.230899  ORF Transcript_81483/g.230899 Transcript_81483/m.230899 type:complete len:202 (+) Transcript_81483:17-622(+)